ncbi:hydroxypyruvate isomerase family protein [Streptomyces sp. NPDC127098]|uniref:hydroxypyruvate isomerase family protein n=1 Tax=Streptomyces sp. NPDC127098 TaxID=3347137 RepID=UPI003668BE40
MRHRLPYTINLSMLLTELPLVERPAAARRLGFDAVEFWWPFATAVPADAEVEAFVRSVRDAGVRLTGLNFFAGDLPGGDRGLVSWPARAAEFRDGVDVAVAIGERLGCRAFNALYGNRADGVAPAAQDETAVANLTLAAEAVARVGGVALLEPLSGAPAYPLRTAADAVAVIDRVAAAAGGPHPLLLADLYHLAVNGEDPAGMIAAHADRVGHVQIADAPGRGAPGTGRLDLDGALVALENAGYTGRVGLEYQPAGPSADSLDWLPRERRAADHVG